MKDIDNQIYQRRWLILFTVVLTVFMACLDGSIVNVALPVMARKLSVKMSSIQWVVTSYLIIISATILIFGRLADIKGKTYIFQFGIVLFTLGSMICGFSDTLPVLILSRIIQAVGAAGTMATSQGIITQVFPDHERGRALGISGASVALGTLVGPPLGGVIVSVLSWKYIFLINLPIGILTWILSKKTFPRTFHTRDEKLDVQGAVLLALGIVLVSGSLIFGQNFGFTHPLILLGFIIAAICITVFILVERVVKMPLLQLDIFKNSLFSISIFCGFISFVAISSPTIIQPFYIQYVLKLSPSTTGLFMMVYPLVLVIAAPISGYISDKIGSEILTFIGLCLTGAGLLLMTTLNEHSTLLTMIIFGVVMSIGNGLFQSPNNSLVMSSIPRNRLGIAGSINALVRNLGMVFGISLSTMLLYNRMSYKIGYHVTNYIPGRDDVFVYAMRYVFIMAGAVSVLGAFVTFFRLYKKKGLKKTYNKLTGDKI